MSALSQSYNAIEVILACNGDLGIEQCQDFLQIDDKRLVYIKTQQGRHHARNEAMQIAKGDYIQFLDYDDYLYKDKIELQVEALQGKAAGNSVSICKWKKFNDNITEGYRFPFNHLFDKQHNCLVEVLESLGRNDGFIATISWLVPKTLVQDIKWIDAPNDDAVFFSEMCLKKPQVVMVNKELAGYRMHGSNTSTITSKSQLESLLIGWKQIGQNLKTFSNKDINKYIYRAYTILLSYSVDLGYYKFTRILVLLVVFGIKSKRGILHLLKDIKSSFN